MPDVTLKKLTGPARTADQVGQVDAVLLSHDHADLYITGDTVRYDGVAEVARRFRPEPWSCSAHTRG